MWFAIPGCLAILGCLSAVAPPLPVAVRGVVVLARAIVSQGDFGHADIFLDRYLENLVIIYKDVLTQIPI